MVLTKLHNLDFSELVSFLGDEFSHNLKVEILENVDSTNSYILSLLKSRALAERSLVVLAKEQTLGRGRLDRKWFSANGASICLSQVVKVSKKAKNLESFTIRAGVKICEKLNSFCGSSFFIKWPNDIYTIDGLKVAGMLAQLVLNADENHHYIVFGVGINFDLSVIDSFEIPKEICGYISDICSNTTSKLSINTVVAEVVKGISEATDEINSNTSFVENFDSVNWLKNRNITLDCANKIYTGNVLGINESGNLIIESDGITNCICSGEVVSIAKDWRL